MKKNVQAAGPGGPPSLQGHYGRKLINRQAVLAACDDLLRSGARPSITKVEAASSVSRSTINRDPCLSVLRGARTRFDLMASGLTFDEALAVIGESAARPEPDEPADGALEPLDPVVATLERKVAKLEAELQRRDDQLYHALGIIRPLRRTLAWHREQHAALTLRLEALSAEPIEARPARRWKEDMLSTSMGDFFDYDDDDEDDEDDERGQDDDGGRNSGNGRVAGDPIARESAQRETAGLSGQRARPSGGGGDRGRRHGRSVPRPPPPSKARR